MLRFVDANESCVQLRNLSDKQSGQWSDLGPLAEPLFQNQKVPQPVSMILLVGLMGPDEFGNGFLSEIGADPCVLCQ